jgi:hypothetical protein
MVEIGPHLAALLRDAASWVVVMVFMFGVYRLFMEVTRRTL